MDIGTAVTTLKQLFSKLITPGMLTQDVHRKLEVFRQSDNWAVCQKVLSEPSTPENRQVMLFCAQCCLEYVGRYWQQQPHALKEERRNFLWLFVSSRVSGQAAVPLPILNYITDVLFLSFN